MYNSRSIPTILAILAVLLLIANPYTADASSLLDRLRSRRAGGDTPPSNVPPQPASEPTGPVTMEPVSPGSRATRSTGQPVSSGTQPSTGPGLSAPSTGDGTGRSSYPHHPSSDATGHPRSSHGGQPHTDVGHPGYGDSSIPAIPGLTDVQVDPSCQDGFTADGQPCGPHNMNAPAWVEQGPDDAYGSGYHADGSHIQDAARDPSTPHDHRGPQPSHSPVTPGHHTQQPPSRSTTPSSPTHRGSQPSHGPTAPAPRSHHGHRGPSGDARSAHHTPRTQPHTSTSTGGLPADFTPRSDTVYRRLPSGAIVLTDISQHGEQIRRRTPVNRQ